MNPKERYSWLQWDTLMREFYNAIYAANRIAKKSGGSFSQKLKERLERLKANEEVLKILQKKPELGRKVVLVMPCGRKTFYTFIDEIEGAKE